MQVIVEGEDRVELVYGERDGQVDYALFFRNKDRCQGYDWEPRAGAHGHEAYLLSPDGGEERMNDSGAVVEVSPSGVRRINPSLTMSEFVRYLESDNDYPLSIDGLCAFTDRLERLAKMSPAERMMEGLKGDREARSVLVRDPNRMVYTAVLHSPRLTLADIQGFASMTDVSPEVLRCIASARNWTKHESVCVKLVLNPTTPADVVTHLMPRLPTKELQRLAKLEQANETVRLTALDLLRSRGQAPL